MQSRKFVTLTPSQLDLMSHEEIRQVAHELSVHKIELERQNEELRRAQLERDVAVSDYADLCNFLPVGFCTLNEAGMISHINPSGANLLGAACAELLNKPINQFILEQYQDAFYLFRKQFVKSDKQESFELQMLKKDGSQFWAQALIYDPESHRHSPIQRIMLIDITERKNTELALQERESWLNEIINLMPIMLFIKDADSNLILMNRLCETRWGASSIDLLGTNASRVLSPEQLACFLAQDREVFNSGQLTEFEETLYNKQLGEPRSIHVYKKPIFDKDGKPRYLICMLLDITERKRAEAQLRANKLRYETLFNRASDGILILSAVGKIMEANESFAHIHGFTVAEMLSMDLSDLLTPESKMRAPGLMQRILAGNTIIFETEHYHKDGHSFSLEVSASQIVVNDEPMLQIFTRDISERNAMRTKLLISQSLLEKESNMLAEAMRDLRLLAFDNEISIEEEKRRISRELHDELGQLLTALRIDIGLLNMDYSEKLPDLLQTTNNMLSILDRAVASMRSVVRDLRPIALDLGLVSMLGSLKNDFTKMFHIPCIFSYRGNIPDLDDVKLTNIFRITQELLTNIAKHAQAKVVHLDMSVKENILQLTVQDNGVGFDSELSTKNLRCFGLMGVRERVLTLNGTLEIDTTPSMGCRVVLSFPIEGGRHD